MSNKMNNKVNNSNKGIRTEGMKGMGMKGLLLQQCQYSYCKAETAVLALTGAVEVSKH